MLNQSTHSHSVKGEGRVEIGCSNLYGEPTGTLIYTRVRALENIAGMAIQIRT